MTELTPDIIRKLPKTDLHVHLDGSLRIPTLIELAKERKVKLPSETVAGLRELVFKDSYRNLPEYLEGFLYTTAVMSDAEAIERIAYEFCLDNQEEGVRYVEVRFAPQLSVRDGLSMSEVVRAVDRGLRRAAREFNEQPAVKSGSEPKFVAGMILCAMRYFEGNWSQGFGRFFEAMPEADRFELYSAASVEVARAAARLRDEGCLVVGIDLAGQEKGYPAGDHKHAYQIAHESFLGKTVHAGEDYGPESIFQAIGDLHADRIGHGTWLFSEDKIHTPIANKKAYVESLVQFVADKRITLEVCLTSNQQTVPELAEDLSKHPFAEMRKRKLSTTFCADNRLVSNTTPRSRGRLNARWRRSTCPPGSAGFVDLRGEEELLSGQLPREAAVRTPVHRLGGPDPRENRERVAETLGGRRGVPTLSIRPRCRGVRSGRCAPPSPGQ